MHKATIVSTDTNYLHRIQAGPFGLDTDEPKALGGQGGAPAPFDYYLASLSACTAITLRMYAQRKAGPWANSAPSWPCASTSRARRTSTASCIRTSRSPPNNGNGCWRSWPTRQSPRSCATAR